MQAASSPSSPSRGMCPTHALPLLLSPGASGGQGWHPVLFLGTWQELGQRVSALTNAIAKRPYK